jgi:hypothetical protein
MLCAKITFQFEFAVPELLDELGVTRGEDLVPIEAPAPALPDEREVTGVKCFSPLV